jgi:hypothetical protein
MTQEEFIGVLDEKGYSYKIEGDKLVVTRKGYVDLNSLTSLPPDVVFNNGGGVNLRSLTSLPPDVVFNNVLDVNLNSLTSLPPGVEFNNGGSVYLRSLIGGGFEHWSGNIDGIYNKMLLNLMIKQGVFI